MLRSKVKQSVAGAEALKRRLRETPVSPRPATATTTPPPSENCKILRSSLALNSIVSSFSSSSRSEK